MSKDRIAELAEKMKDNTSSMGGWIHDTLNMADLLMKDVYQLALDIKHLSILLANLEDSNGYEKIEKKTTLFKDYLDDAKGNIQMGVDAIENVAGLMSKEFRVLDKFADSIQRAVEKGEKDDK